MEQRLNDLFIRIVDENRTAMFRMAYSMLLNREDAEDVVSEAVLKAYSHLPELRNVTKMKAWLFQILVNESKSCLKKRNRIDLVEDVTLFAESGREDKSSCDLLEFVYQLEDIFREVVILYYFEEFSVREIAKILNISAGTVKSRLARARLKLKSFLEEKDDQKG